LALIFGVANALLLFGPGPIDPTNIDWIFGDNATYYFGWASYRNDPHLRFPLAWTDRIGYPIGASIAWLDAIPLVALVLRPFSGMLPEPFQYLGLYSVACFVLQAYFGLSLSKRLFPSQPVFAVLASLFFVLSAPLTWRAFGHTALLSHWLILAGLDGYFRDPDPEPLRCLGRLWIVVALAAAINPYVAAMCVLIAIAGVARLAIERRCSWRRAAVLLAATVGVLALTMTAIGVLASRDASSYRAPGYGLLSMNLNAPVNPMEYGSILIPPLPVMDPRQLDGYNYLGLGVIALLMVNLVRRPTAVRWLADRRLLPLVGVAIVSALLAISTTVSLGSSRLFEIALPEWAAAPLHGLRASGRLFWPAYYLIVTAALSLTFNLWKAPHRVAILAIALVVQAADLMPLRNKVRSTVDQRFESPLRSPTWKGLGEKYQNLILVPPYQCSPTNGAGGFYSFVDFGKYSADEHLRSNSYYGARYTRFELEAHCVDILRSQLAGTLDPNSAYVVTDAVRTVWSLAGMRSHSCRRVDGYNLCTPSTPEDANHVSEPPPAPAYAAGTMLDFTAGGNARDYVILGWGAPLADGTWTEGPMALLRLGFAADKSRPLVLEANITGFVARNHPRLDVDVVVNGQTVDRWVVRSTSRSSRRTSIPPSTAALRQGLDVEFRMRNPQAPIYVGAGPSSTFLGLQVRELVIRYE
jgi:hypothetical protein